MKGHIFTDWIRKMMFWIMKSFSKDFVGFYFLKVCSHLLNVYFFLVFSGYYHPFCELTLIYSFNTYLIKLYSNQIY